MSEGWIKLHRQIMDWGWYTDNNVKALFIHLLLRARHQAGERKGVKLDVGQLITSIKSLCRETGMSERVIRAALEKLESTGEIHKESTTQYTLITINNWIVYQANNEEEAKPENSKNEKNTSKKHTKNQQKTTNKNGNNGDNEENDESICTTHTYGYHGNVHMTEDEYKLLCGHVVSHQDYIDRLSDHIASTGAKYKSHFATIIKWARKDNRLMSNAYQDDMIFGALGVRVFTEENDRDDD